MKNSFLLALIVSFLASGCGRVPTSASGSSFKNRDVSDPSGTATDPIVAHFFNTATDANNEAAVLAATQDGGANADAGN
jgi:hypothetical protein